MMALKDMFSRTAYASSEWNVKIEECSGSNDRRMC